ncbi:hypothetical protein AAHE18_08G181700 [Arachis hypogaea]|nr:uncharacterized protein DS421_8g245120 [Arachis hypogaea]
MVALVKEGESKIGSKREISKIGRRGATATGSSLPLSHCCCRWFAAATVGSPLLPLDPAKCGCCRGNTKCCLRRCQYPTPPRSSTVRRNDCGDTRDSHDPNTAIEDSTAAEPVVIPGSCEAFTLSS